MKPTIEKIVFESPPKYDNISKNVNTYLLCSTSELAKKK